MIITLLMPVWNALIELKDFVNYHPIFFAFVLFFFNGIVGTVSNCCKKHKIFPGKASFLHTLSKVVIFAVGALMTLRLPLWLCGYDTFLLPEKYLLSALVVVALAVLALATVFGVFALAYKKIKGEVR